MEIYKIESNGKTFTFNVVKNTTKSCPECGIPACGQEDILWYENNNKRISVIFDGAYFNLAVEEFLNQNLKTINYNSLPEFIKEWNEARGWSDNWNYEGYDLDIDDFLNSLNLLKNCKTSKWISEAEIINLHNLALEAKEKGKKLKIVRG